MGYWKAKRERDFLYWIKSKAILLFQAMALEADIDCKIAGTYVSQISPAKRPPLVAGQYEIRETLMRKVHRIDDIESSLMIGNQISALLQDASTHDNSFDRVLDRINIVIGAAEDRVQYERRHLLNPLHWLKLAFFWLLRIPSKVIRAMGFSVEKFEDQMWGKVFVTIMVIAILLFAYFGAHYTINQLVEILLRFLPRP